MVDSNFSNGYTDRPFTVVEDIINRHFTVVSTSYQPIQGKDGTPLFVPVYEVLKRSDLSQKMKLAIQELENIGYIALLREHPELSDSRVYLIVREFRPKVRTKRSPNTLPIVLFVATVASVFVFGFVAFGLGPMFNFVDILLYVIGLIGIVGIHESGHLLASRRHKIEASLPYFIPMPFFLGTMGAFINQRTPLRDRNALFDLGISGPLAGLIVAIIAVIIGIFISPVVLEASLPEGTTTLVEFMGFGIVFYDILASVIASFRYIPDGYTLILHPLAFAGWVGLVITGLNLIPVGQLDGGHVARSLLNQNAHRIITYIAAFLMIIIGFFFMAMLILFFYMWAGHPGPLDDVGKVTNSRKIIAIALFAFALICIPLPTEFYYLVIQFLGL
ncbi:MAG: site-2 protease family protein [Candidatus Hermodarchaeota archaeon]